MKAKEKQRKSEGSVHRYKRGIVHSILIALVLIVLVARFFRGDYYSVFLCLLTLLLFNIPLIVDHAFKVSIPKTLEIIILFFIFAAEILGEIGSFYTYISWWDTMLHTLNGFLMAAIGFAMIDVLNNHPKFHISLSPVFVAVVAFCFSMTVGVVWEFFEFFMDSCMGTDMQKDRMVQAFASVALNPNGVNDPITVKGIAETVIVYEENGQELTRTLSGGYLDIGVIDTMKDLIVNCIGAVVFSIVGYFYILGRNKGIFASRFIPRMKTAEEIAEHERLVELWKEEHSLEKRREEIADLRQKRAEKRRSNTKEDRKEDQNNDEKPDKTEQKTK